MSDRLSTTKTCVNNHESSTATTTSRKRKSPCDIIDLENPTPPAKKLVTVPPSMSVDFLSRSSRSLESSSPASPDYRSSECGAIHLQQTTSRDTHRGATSPLMSVDFLARSSRSPHAHRTAAGTEFAFAAPVGLGHPSCPYVYYILYWTWVISACFCQPRTSPSHAWLCDWLIDLNK